MALLHESSVLNIHSAAISLCFAIIDVLWIYWTIVIALVIGDRSVEINVLWIYWTIVIALVIGDRSVEINVLWIYWTIVITLLIGDRSVEIDVLLDNSYWSGNWRSLC
ncbi:MAG: hypothetical protein F6K17_38515 [Okeania sp. SIO3C4]|nr:hypothetical protein [Okeania sp. SIO3C4]